ncbi:acyl-CoA dehydrogenase family protein [Thermodesulfobacteriota bacterium]
MNLDLGFNKSEEMLKATSLEFMRRDAPKDVIESLHETDLGYTKEIWEKAVKIGWLGIIIPEKYGGIGDSLTSAGILYEALGTGPLPGPYFSSGILSSSIILEAGNEEQKKTILPEIAEGRRILTLALTESEYSWKPESVHTQVNRSNGGYDINGVKLFTPDAQSATDFIIVARIHEEIDSAKSIALFIVDAKSPGISVRELPGFFATRTFEVKLNSVKVQGSARLGNMVDAWPALKRGIDKSIPVLCAYKVGGCQAVFNMALEYSRIRVQFGQPIGRFQRVQDMIIKIVNDLDAARWTTYGCLWKLDTKRPANESVHLAKAVTSQAYWDVCTQAHRVFSGISYAKDHPLSFHTKTSRQLYHYLGDPSFHRNQLVQLLLDS